MPPGVFCDSADAVRDNDDANFQAIKPLENVTSLSLSVSNGANVSRTQNITAYVQWNKVLTYSEIKHNGKNSDPIVFDWYRMPAPYSGNWTNYTLFLANATEFNRTGQVNVTQVHANDSYSQDNMLTDVKYFNLWSSANISEGELSRNITYNGTDVDIWCRVLDNYTGSPVQGYSVSFFNSTSYISSSLTDFNGGAFAYYSDSTQNPPQNITLKCNITNMPSIYYNSSFEWGTLLQVVDLRANIYPLSDVPFGSNITIRANITGNATKVTSVNADVTYYNYSNKSYQTDYLTMVAVRAYSPTSTEYSANYTTKAAGPHNVTVEAWAEPQSPDPARYAANTTSFSIGGGANITNISLSSSIIYNGSSTNLKCRVANNVSGAPVALYNVSFFNSTTFLGARQTNSSGWANITFADATANPPQNITLKCNITDMPEMYYNASSEMNTTLQVVDLRVSILPVNDTTFGQSITLRINVTGNASHITGLGATVGYYDFATDSYQSEIVNLILDAAYSPINTGYRATYTAKRSGVNNFSVSATMMDGRNAKNSTLFNVSYGVSSVSFVFPNFRVLANQTFNFTVNISAASGDITKPTLVLGFTNESMMNVTEGELFSKVLQANITNGTSRSFVWNVTASGIGLLRANVSATPEKGTASLSDTPFSVISHVVSVNTSAINITGNETVKVKVVGNTSAIQTVNLTVVKPYSGGNNAFSGKFIGTETETSCLGVGAGTGNVAVGANTSCSSGVDCGLAVDDWNLTAWTEYTSGKWLTINLSQKYVVDTIELVWAGGATNTSIFYKRSLSTGGSSETNFGGWSQVSEFQQKDAPLIKNTTTIKVLPFETDTLLLNDSTVAGLSIYELRIYPIDARADKCYIYEINYTSVNSSGTHNVSSNVLTNSSIGPNLGASSFFVNFGTPYITAAFGDTHLMGVETYTYTILAQNGDLRGMNSTLAISNKTVLNFSDGESVTKNTAYVAYGTSELVSWSLNATTPGEANLSAFTNSTSGLGGSGGHNTSIAVIMNDVTPPNISWFSLSQNASNLRGTIVVTVNASDNYQVRNVTAEVRAPSFNFNQTNWTSAKSEGLWTITLDPELINSTGTYYLNVSVEDIAGNTDTNTSSLSFNVYDSYSVLPGQNYTEYSRGESVVFRAYDANNATVSGAYWMVNRSFESGNDTTNSTTIFNGTIDEFTYSFMANTSPGTYHLNISVDKLGNSGNYTGNMTLNSTLNLVFAQPLAGSEYNAGDSITSPSRPRVMVKNVHNEFVYNITVNGGSIYLICPGSPSPIGLVYEYSYYWGGDAYTTEDRPDKACKVPSSAGSFTLNVNATDQYNNTGIGYTGTLSVKAANTPQNPGSPGGGTSSGFSGGSANSNATQNVTYIYTKSEVRSFNFSIDRQEIEIMQGKEETIIVSVANTGDFDMNLAARNSETNLSLSYSNRIFLAKGADIDSPLKIRARLSTMPGEYFVTIYLSGEGMEKSRAFKVNVLENPDLSEINALVSEMSSLEERMQDYAAAGIDVSSVQQKLDFAKSYLVSAEQASAEGDVDTLSQSVESSRMQVDSAKAELDSYNTKKFFLENKEKIAAGWIISVIFLYALAIFILPYTKISRRLYALRREEKILTDARKASETQYFMRKINDATFQKIMTDEQDKLYKIRSEAKRLEEELSLLRRFKFGEIEKIRNEWKVKMKEAEKSKMVQAVQAQGNAGAFGKRENIFIRAAKIIRGKLSGKKPAYSRSG